MVNTASQNEPIFARFTFPPLPTILLVTYSTRGGELFFALYCIPPSRIIFSISARLLGFLPLLPLPFAQAHPGPAAVLGYELSAARL
jgi:hypothetical protein